jgi:hypothetical protein
MSRDMLEKRSGDSRRSSLSDAEKFPEIARTEAWLAAANESASRILIARINCIATRKRSMSGMRVSELSTFPRSSEITFVMRTQRMPFMASSEFLRIAESRGAATVQIAVTSPVVIRTTSTHPGTSPRSSLSFLTNELSRIAVLADRTWSSSQTSVASALSLKD